MCSGIGVNNVAGELSGGIKVGFGRIGRERERMLFSVLPFQAGEIDRAPVDACRSAGFKTAKRNAQFGKRGRKTARGQKSVRPAFIVSVSHKNPAVEIGAGRDDDCTATVNFSQPGAKRSDSPGFVRQNIGDLCLHKAQMGCLFKNRFHIKVVGFPVGLHAFGMNGGAFSEIQCAGLQCHGVGRPPHFTAERVDLIDQMALGRSANGGIAGHIGYGFQ